MDTLGGHPFCSGIFWGGSSTNPQSRGSHLAARKWGSQNAILNIVTCCFHEGKFLLRLSSPYWACLMSCGHGGSCLRAGAWAARSAAAVVLRGPPPFNQRLPVGARSGAHAWCKSSRRPTTLGNSGHISSIIPCGSPLQKALSSTQYFIPVQRQPLTCIHYLVLILVFLSVAGTHSFSHLTHPCIPYYILLHLFRHSPTR